MKDELLRLAAICEKAEGPDRCLGLEIAVASDRRPYWLASEVGEMWLDRSGVYPVIRWASRCIGRSSGNPSVDDPPRFTESIDAALTLVPEDMRDEIEITTLYCVARVEINMNHGPDGGPFYGNNDCNSIPLAICAAALKARASMENPQ